MLTALGSVTTSLAVPAVAQAGEPSATNKRDYDRAFESLKRDVNDQIANKNLIYESTIKRQRKKLDTTLGYMKRNDGVDIAPYQKEIDDFIKEAYARLEVTKLAKARPNA